MEAKPWLPEKAISFLQKIITPDSFVLEHGAGGSTLWFAERVSYILSFESDSKWYGKVGAELYNRGHLIGRTNAFGTATLIFASMMEDMSFKMPATVPREYDLVFVDGRGRVRFWERAEKFLKPGGWLIWDDAERKKYWTDKGLSGLDLYELRDWVWDDVEKAEASYLAKVPSVLADYWPVVAFNKPEKPGAYTLFARKPNG